MEREWQSMIILSIFFILSLVGAVVLFSYLESYAEVANPTYRLGGAIAGFFVIFTTLCYTYSKLIEKPASKVIKEATKVITKPKGFNEYRSSDLGFLIYYPKEWKVSEPDYSPPIEFARGDGPTLNIVTEKMSKEVLGNIEENPSAFSDSLERTGSLLFRDWKRVEKSTIAIRGVQCPMQMFEKQIGHFTLRMVQISYLDMMGEKAHHITWTSSVDEYEDVKPLFEKMVSTFQTI